MRHIPLLPLAALAVLAACQGDRVLTPPGASTPARPSLLINDGTNLAIGNKDFWFLPPVMPEPTGWAGYKDKAFYAGLAARIRLTYCLLSAVPSGDPAKVLQDDAITCASGESVSGMSTVTQSSDKYQATWNTGSAGLVVAGTNIYRVRVYVDQNLIGYFDVDPVSNGSQLRNIATGDIIGLVDGRTLPINFRIEYGALCVSRSDCNEFPVTNAGGAFAVEGAGVYAPAGFLDGTGQTQVTAKLERQAVPDENNHCDSAWPSSFVLEYEGCYRLTLTPQVTVAPSTALVVGVCLEPDGQSSSVPLTLVRSNGSAEPPAVLDAADPQADGFPDFLADRCAKFAGSSAAMQSSNPLLDLAYSGWRALGRGANHVFGVTPLWAAPVNQYAKYSAACCSLIRWAYALSMDYDRDNAGVAYSNNQTAAVNTFVRLNPTVILRASRPSYIDGSLVPAPTSVAFTVTGGGGCVLPAVSVGPPGPTCASTLTVQSGGGDGRAAVAWMLGPSVGTQTLQASATALGSPITFTANATPCSSVGGPAAGGVIFRATFTYDGLNQPPCAPDIGSWTNILAQDGTVLVRSSVGNITTKPLEVANAGVAPGSPGLTGQVAGTAPTTGVWVARWRSVISSAATGPGVRWSTGFAVDDDNPSGAQTVSVLFYQQDGRAYLGNSLTTQVALTTWTMGVSQLFEEIIDLDARTLSIKVDGVPVAAAQQRAFEDSAARSISRLHVFTSWPDANVLGWDDAEIRSLGTPSITTPSLGSTTVVLGVQTPYTVTVQNPTGLDLSTFSLRAEVHQGAAIRTDADTPVSCPPNAPGLLPAGGCSMSPSFTASNTAGGAGTLVPGSATVVFKLIRVARGKTIEVDSKSVAITLVPPS